MEFQKLVKIYEQLESISSGNEIRRILSEFFKEVPIEDIGIVSYLTLGKLGSEFESIILGIAEKSVLKAIGACGGVSINKVKEVMRKKGDVGLTAEELLENKPQTLIPVGKLTIHEFIHTLHKMASMSGNGSQERKEKALVGMLQKVTPTGAKYVTRVVLGTLRMGVGEMSVLDSLAIAFTGEKKNKQFLEKAFNICPDVGEIAVTLARDGLQGLEKINVKIGRPIRMMLAQRISSLDEVSKKMPGVVAVEGKYDGERVQVHKKGEEVMLFSRRLDTITSQFPDLVKYVQEHITKDCIIEGEILAIDENGKPRPFQTLMQRRRKYDIEKFIKEVPVQLKVFELLYSDGVYMNKPYGERVAKLRDIISKNKHVMVADHMETENVEDIDAFFHKMLNDGYEGIMIKSLSGEYQAGTRGWNWIKWKKEYVHEMSDNFDLVIVGAFHGKGKRSGVYGALLCAVYDSSSDRYLTLCKVGTGLTDEVLAELPKRLKKYESKNKPINVVVKKEMIPDVWFEPEVVIEVLAAEVTKSPFHTAGVALRFPRFITFRDDKKSDQATTLIEVKEMA
jgi:DNA ligase 1